MAESHTDKRVVFSQGQQTRFIASVQQKIPANNFDLSRLAKVSPRTVSDWKRERTSLPLSATQIFSKRSGIAIPKNVKIKKAYWHVKIAASAGGRSVYKKYGTIGGDKKSRMRKWRVWWNTKGRFQKHPIINAPKPIRKPSFSPTLAEFVGIILGDGGISKRQVVITLHRSDDKVYSIYVRMLIKALFRITPGIHRHKSSLADDIVVSRVELVRFCTNILGLKIGNKVTQQVSVPAWIKKDKRYKIACLRGLVDTDGSVFVHQYTVCEKLYRYKKLSFTNASKPLVIYVFETLRQLGMHPRIARNGTEARLDSQSDMKKYFHLVKSHNEKHLNRWND